MNNFTLIFIVFFLFHGFAKGFDYWKIAQTWPPGFCREKQCIPGKETLMKFTIHGLWPSIRSSTQGSTNCGNMPLPKMGGIESELQQDWPNLLDTNDTEFWSDQWKKHGTCSYMMPFDFFMLALDIYARNDLQAILNNAGILSGGNYDKNHIISAISISVGAKPQVVCSKASPKHVIEIRLCLDTNQFPSYINCPSQWSTTCDKGLLQQGNPVLCDQ
ncbi:hypothetical protein ACSQ67_008327 [Phaseolus vulgaris]